ncbi:MAG: DUF4340 domain-containing protein [Brevinematia bacterium]
MRLNSRLMQWILVLLFFILSFSIYILKVIPLNKQKKDSFVIGKLNPFEITSIEILRFLKNSKERLVITNNNKWFISYPFSEEADEGRINKLIDEINSCKIEGEIQNSSNLYEYNLDPPLVKILIRFKNSTEKEICIGEKTIDEKYRYIYNPQYSNKIVLSYSYKLETPFLNISDFRNKIIFNIPVDQIEKIVLKSPEMRSITLRKTNDNWYSVEKNRMIPITNFNEKLIDIYSLMVNAFIKNPVSGFKPYYEISLYSKKMTNTLLISKTNEEGKWIARTEDKKELFLIEKDDLKDIFKIYK